MVLYSFAHRDVLGVIRQALQAVFRHVPIGTFLEADVLGGILASNNAF